MLILYIEHNVLKSPNDGLVLRVHVGTRLVKKHLSKVVVPPEKHLPLIEEGEAVTFKFKGYIHETSSLVLSQLC